MTVQKNTKPKPRATLSGGGPDGSTRLVAVIALVVACAALAWGVFQHRHAASVQTVTDEAVQRFIEENPQLIIETLNQHATLQAEAERLQSVNLAKTNDGRTVMGNPAGDVTIYEFSDYNCGYCKRVFVDLMRLVKDDGNIRLVVKEFPILSEGSVAAARYALAAAEIGKFEEFHRAAMEWPGGINQHAVDQIVTGLGIDKAALESEISTGTIDSIIAENGRIAKELRLTGTPAFIIGNTIVPGAIRYDDLRKLVKQARNDAGNG